MAEDYKERIERFKADLHALEPREVVRKHITMGQPSELSEADYFSLQDVIAQEFTVHPSAVILVGSCRTGFSLVEDQRYQPAHAGSDLDVAVISRTRFEDYWRESFDYSQSVRLWPGRQRFLSALFKGWIDPRWLPPVERFESATRWVKFFDELMHSRRFGTRRISARLYYSHHYLETYQQVIVLECREELRKAAR